MNKAEKIHNEIVTDAKNNIIKSNDNINVSMILSTMDVYRTRYKYDGEYNEVSFFFGEYDIIMGYCRNKSSINILTKLEREEDEEIDDLVSFNGDIGNTKYDNLSPENKLAFDKWVSTIGSEIRSEIIYETFRLLFKNIMKLCKSEGYSGYY